MLWVEEPLAGTDLRGLAALRASAPGVRIAGGEMTRTFAEQLAALDADAFDVHQSDVVLAAGMSRTRTLAELALARNRWFTPHTWTNGIGLLANLHVAAGVGGGPFLEFPYDPPGLDPGAPRLHARRADPARRRRCCCAYRAPGPRHRPRRGRARGGSRHDEGGAPPPAEDRHAGRRPHAPDRAVIEARVEPAAGVPFPDSPAATARRSPRSPRATPRTSTALSPPPVGRSTTAAGLTSRRPPARRS